MIYHTVACWCDERCCAEMHVAPCNIGCSEPELGQSICLMLLDLGPWVVKLLDQ